MSWTVQMRLACLVLGLVAWAAPAAVPVALAQNGATLQAPAAAPAIASPSVAPPSVAGPVPSAKPDPLPSIKPPDVKKGVLYLSASLARDGQVIATGPLHWRIFDEKTDAQGRHTMIAQADQPAPSFMLAPGTYIVHVALDLASGVRRVTVTSQPSSERLVLNAGALRIVGMLGDKPINPAKLSIAIYVPETGNSEAKLVLPSARAGELIAVPEGNYHIVSTLLDTAGYAGTQKSGVGNKTNSVVSADLKVQAGKLTDATLRHRSAVMTLKLVNDPGGEALANTAFTILTPGGDVIRELIGAFPSVVLAEGEYVVIARHDTKTYPSTFKVTSTLDRDVEVLAK